jgi:nucleoside-diphosphate-sugar epimerase
VPLPALVPSLPVQFIHEDDVGQAFLQCIVAAGPLGAYNITGDGVLTGTEVARELGLAAMPIPAGLTSAAARAATRLPRPPFLPPAVEWVEAATRPSIIDAGKAKRELGWRPRYTSLEALRDTIAAQ